MSNVNQKDSSNNSQATNSSNQVLENAIQALKAVALEKLQVLQGYQQAKGDFERAAKAYQVLTGEVLSEEFMAAKRGRPPGGSMGNVTREASKRDGTKNASRSDVVNYLAANGPKTAREIVDALGGSMHDASELLRRMAEAKDLKRTMKKGLRGMVGVFEVKANTNTKEAVKNSLKQPSSTVRALTTLAASEMPLRPSEIANQLNCVEPKERARIATAVVDLKKRGLVNAKMNGAGNMYSITSAGRDFIASALQSA